MPNRTESNFQKYVPTYRIIKCYKCGATGNTLYRKVAKPAGKDKPLRAENYKNTEYICSECK